MNSLTKFSFYTILLFLIVFSLSYLSGLYETEIKPRFNGYSKNNISFKNKNEIKINGNKINSEIISFLHYYNENLKLDSLKDNVNLKKINIKFLECETNKYKKNKQVSSNKKDFKFDPNIKSNFIFNINCLHNLIQKGEKTHIIYDINQYNCSWRGYKKVYQIDNHYLLDITEKVCGTLPSRFHNFYLVKIDNNEIYIVDSILSGRYPINRLNYFKIINKKIKIITDNCNEGSKNCFGLRPEYFELNFEENFNNNS